MPPQGPGVASLADWVHPSRMVARPGPLLAWLGRTFFGAVRFDDDTVATVRAASRDAVPVFVLSVHSRLDYLVLNFWFLRLGLPLVAFSPGIDLAWFRPLRIVFREVVRRLFGSLRRQPDDRATLRRAVGEGRPCLLFLKRSRTLIQWGAEPPAPLLDELVIPSMSAPLPVRLVPVLVVWDQKPESYRRSVLDLVLGDPQAPGPVRKALSFLRNFRKARVQVGRTIDLPAFLDANRDAGDAASRAARLKFALSNEFLLESKAIRGPVLKGARRIVDEIVRTPPFLEEIDRVAAAEGLAPQAALARARSRLKRMAADFRFGWLEAFAVTIGLFLQRIFTGIAIDTQGLAWIREAARSGPIVLAPAHRSHLDYLVYSFVFYTHGLIPPHIAAGENMAFWPMGPIFRRSGAFFIPRSVKGSRLDAVVLRHYVRKLLKDGYWLEMFPEGTRSRSGKSVTPRLGMLSMTLDAVATGAAPNAFIVPAAVTYEKVVEAPAYGQESQGGEKTRESVVALARSAKVLGSRFGRMYVEFDRPIGVRDLLEDQGVPVPLPPGATVPPDVVRRFAFALMHRIDRNLVVTPYHLVSFALVTHRRRGMAYDLLQQRVGGLVADLARRDAVLSDLVVEALRTANLWPVPDDASPTAIGEALQTEVADVLATLRKQVEIRELDGGAVLSPTPEGRVALDYYKNGILHFLVPDAILATALGPAGTAMPVDRIRARCLDLSRVFRFEFIYPPAPTFDDVFQAHLDRFAAQRLVVRDGDSLTVLADAADAIADRAAALRPFVEAYRITAHALLESSPQASDKDLIKAALRIGRRMYSVGDVELPESVSAVLFGNALRHLRTTSETRSRTLADVARDTVATLEAC